MPRPRKDRAASARMAPAELRGDQYDERAEGVRQDVAEGHPSVAHPECAGRLDVDEFADGEDARSDQASGPRGDHHRDRDDRVHQRRPKGGGQDQGQDQDRQRLHDVHQALHDQIGPAAEIARDEPYQPAQARSQQGRGEAHHERDAGAVHHTAAAALTSRTTVDAMTGRSDLSGRTRIIATSSNTEVSAPGRLVARSVAEPQRVRNGGRLGSSTPRTARAASGAGAGRARARTRRSTTPGTPRETSIAARGPARAPS
jgi:hypothetical protein